jgi:hypothetical protein
MMLNQLQKLFSVERDGRIIKYGEEERSEEKVVVAYFKLLYRHSPIDWGNPRETSGYPIT